MVILLIVLPAFLLTSSGCNQHWNKKQQMEDLVPITRMHHE